DADRIRADGRTHPAPKRDPIRTAPPVPSERSFPAAAYKRCRTSDQRDALATLEALENESATVVLESDRGRGKSSVCGLAAGVLAERGESVSIVASSPQNVTELFSRAREILADRDALVAHERSPLRLDTDSGGAVVYRPPKDAGMLDGPTIVDEAASLSLQTLEATLETDRVAFATTIHGYEGAGRGFSVRFMERLDPLNPVIFRLDTPIRYAPADPIELWAFDALLLNARPAVDQVVAGGAPQYRRLTPADLMDDEALLRETFGLLVLAHYRTEPDDLARLLDAPNLAVRALTVDGHVLAVALLAREGGLSATRRAALYEGGRIRGHMIPDVLTSQLRDELAAAPTGARVLRIATHPARRDEGIGSQLLAEIRAEARDVIPEWADRTGAIDWLGVGFGATPRLVRFWRQNGFSTVHFSTTRNERSGEHSAVMLDPLTAAGGRLTRKVTRRFARRITGVAPASLAAIDTDVLRATLRAVDPAPLAPPTLTDWEWEVVAGVAFGPGLVDVAPTPFAQLAVRYFAETHVPVARDPPEGWSDITGTDALNEEAERVLVGRLLQGRPWPDVRKDGEGDSPSRTKRMLGNAIAPLARRYGSSIVDCLAMRFTDE
ncbi:MAG: tRNA(Met) cytidine acetyltransferase TmcA, partial [Salinarchaeum sp.]